MITRALAITLLTLGGVALADPPSSSSPPLPTPPAAPPSASPPSSTVRVTFITVPMKKAFVYWGKKRLGMIAPRQPLVIERPRDSGPLDVVVRSDGYLAVQTRAYTFADSKVAVKLTAIDQKNTLLGYREEVPPPDGGAPGPDGGVTALPGPVAPAR